MSYAEEYASACMTLPWTDSGDAEEGKGDWGPSRGLTIAQNSVAGVEEEWFSSLRQSYNEDEE